MNVAIIGTGKMARGIATRLLAGGHSVTLFGRDPATAEALAEQLAVVATETASVRARTTGEPIGEDVVILAVPYAAAVALVRDYADQWSGKVIVDITNPLNAGRDGLVTASDTCAAEEIARSAPPGARIGKAFNTTFGRALVGGQVAGQPLDVFIAGDDADAKALVARLVDDGGMRAIDVGPLHSARALEAFQLLHIQLQQQMGTGFMSSVKLLA